MTRFPLTYGEIIRARVEAVYPTIADGSVTLTVVDGPYGMGKAAWDRVRDLAAWYRPHIAEISRVSAASASVYLWNTAEGWAAIHPEVVAAGWDLRTLITWDKIATPASVNPAIVWAPCSEFCGFYTRGDPQESYQQGPNVWRLNSSQYADEVIRGESVRNGLCSSSALHPCQKPLLFARRIIEASSRPGDTVLVPFGGTCRESVANEQIGRYRPEEARNVITIEADEDGRDYIGAVLRSIGEAPAVATGGQVGLFGGGR